MILHIIVYFTKQYGKNSKSYFYDKHPLVQALVIYAFLLLSLFILAIILHVSIRINAESLPSWIIIAILLLCVLLLVVAIVELSVLLLIKHSDIIKKFYGDHLYLENGNKFLKLFSQKKEYIPPYGDNLEENVK